MLKIAVDDFDRIERTWLNTAVSRAKQKDILIVKPNAVKQALARGFRFEYIELGFIL